MLKEDLFKILEPIKIGGSVCRYSMKKCEELVPIVNEINEIKKEKNVSIFSHSYISPDILYTVSDHVGDSYKLSVDAQNSKSDILLFVTVKFMAETAKIMNPFKKVYVSSDFNGCSLADSIDGDQIKKLRDKFKDYTFVCYINTTAEVKAMSDVCVTSSNVYKIIENIENDKIFFLPDKLMGMNIVNEMSKRGIKKDIIFYEDGVCYVHEEYDPDMIDYLRMEYEDLKVLAHPECKEEVIARSDYIGSTNGLLDYIKKNKEGNYLLLTECGLIDRVYSEVPNANLVGSCRFCKYMKSNTLEGVLETLKLFPEKREIFIEENIIKKSYRSIENMFRYANL